MRRWLLLLPAIAVEVTATLALKLALTEPVWFVVVVIGYLASFALLATCLRLGMPLGVTYGLWGAGGVICTAVFARLLLDEPLTGLMSVGIGLIVAGVLTVEVGSQRAEVRP